MKTIIVDTSKPTLSELKERNKELRTENRSLQSDARRLLSTFETLSGQNNGMADGIAELKDDFPEMWELYFSKAANSRRRKKRKTIKGAA